MVFIPWLKHLGVWSFCADTSTTIIRTYTYPYPIRIVSARLAVTWINQRSPINNSIIIFYNVMLPCFQCFHTPIPCELDYDRLIIMFFAMLQQSI